MKNSSFILLVFNKAFIGYVVMEIPKGEGSFFRVIIAIKYGGH